MKIRPVGSELFRADRRIKKLRAAFRNFENAPTNEKMWALGKGRYRKMDKMT